MSEVAIDYRSLEWMPKSVWGPIKWRELHCRALVDLPMDDEQEWFRNFREGLPCAKCRVHFEDYIAHHPPDFSSREKFFQWTVDAHNHVNQHTGKKIVSLDEAHKIHEYVFDDPA